MLEEYNIADRVECIGKVQGDQCPVWMSLRKFLIPCTCSPALLACPLQTAQGECTRVLLLEVTHDCRADELVVEGPYGNGPYYATIFLGYWNQPSTKEVLSEVLWDEQVIGSYPLFTQLTDGIDSL